MKIAIIGSRGIKNIADIEKYVGYAEEIVSGGAVGTDTCARKFALEKGLKLTEFLPEYNLYGRAAPLKRNEQMVEMADEVLVIWDGNSRGAKYTLEYAKKTGKPITLVRA